MALARALASGPKLLLLDEPFGALDAVVRKQLRAGLKEIVRSVGVTTVRSSPTDSQRCVQPHAHRLTCLMASKRDKGSR